MKITEILLENLNNIDLNQAYELFKQTYEKSTGTAWSRDKFFQRAQNWVFYGTPEGYITVRPQRSGLIKLTGAGGNPRGILKGIQELQAENKPVWGMVSKSIASQVSKLGFIQPPGLLLKALATMVPAGVFGDVPYKVNFDGSITFDYSDVGSATKYFIANRQYFSHMLQQLESNQVRNIGDKTKNMLISSIRKII